MVNWGVFLLTSMVTKGFKTSVLPVAKLTHINKTNIPANESNTAVRRFAEPSEYSRLCANDMLINTVKTLITAKIWKLCVGRGNHCQIHTQMSPPLLI